MTNKVMSVAMLSPKIMVHASGASIPSVVRVIIPITVVNVVLRIGLILDFALALIASVLFCQSF